MLITCTEYVHVTDDNNNDDFFNDNNSDNNNGEKDNVIVISMTNNVFHYLSNKFIRIILSRNQLVTLFRHFRITNPQNDAHGTLVI